MKTIFTLLVACVALAGVGGFLVWRGEAPSIEPPSLKAVKFASDWVAANGVVEGARPEISIRPELVETIAQIYVHENQDVSKGTLLAELNNDSQQGQVALASAEVAIAKGQLERLRNGEQAEKRKAVAAAENARLAVYQQAKADWERAQKLIREGAITQEEYDAENYKMLRALAELEEGRAERALVEAPARADEVAVAEAKITAAEAKLRLAEVELSKTRLRAPANCRILQVYAEPGEMAGPTSRQPILLLANLSKRRVRAFVEELDACRVRVGQRALVTADGVPGKEFPGNVAVVLPRMGKRTPQSDAPGEYKDLYFREVLIDLGKGDELPLNLRVQASIHVGPAESTR